MSCVTVVALVGCSRGDRKPAAASQPAPGAAGSIDEQTAQLRGLYRRGRFEEFAKAALGQREESADASLESLRAEALLSLGRNDEGEASAADAAQLAIEAGDAAEAAAALRLWITARFRQGKSIERLSSDAAMARLDADDLTLSMVRFWSDALDGRATYRVGAAPEIDTRVALSKAEAGSVPTDLHAIEAQANGVNMPRVFIDTGAQHTLMTVEAAKEAGALVGAGELHLVGFSGLKARPGLLKSLSIGGVVLQDVPVLVGNSPPLVAAKGQMALGIELMHHVRFTIDYPGARVWAQAVGEPMAIEAKGPAWEIPLWTFSKVCLARGRMVDGPLARVLVDTGDRRGTFVSTRWARRALKKVQWPDSSLVFHFKARGLSLDAMELGTERLTNWPVLETMPGELERLDLVDVLLGHDLLSPYRLTIDLRRRVLRLDDSTAVARGGDGHSARTDGRPAAYGEN